MRQRRLERNGRRARIGLGVFAAIVLAAAVTMLATVGHDLLPPLFLNQSRPDLQPMLVRVNAVLIALFVVAMAMLFRKRNSVLDMWLLVALSGWLIQSLLILTLQARFTVGWYCLFAMLLFSHLVVMLALIAESNRLYARLALSTAARNRERDARLMSMDAVTAAISHEVGQPLTAVTTQCDGRPELAQPCSSRIVEKAIKSLRATIDAGHRTFDVIKSIRAMFAKGPGTATEFSLNDLVRETASLLDRELAGEKVSLQLALDEALPPVLADRVQIQRVLVNLFTNAIESLARRGAGLAASRSARRRWTARTCCSRSAIPASASRPRRWRTSSRPSSRPRRPAPAWACRSAAPSSRSMAGVSGPRRARSMARPSTCSCRAAAGPRNDGRL